LPEIPNSKFLFPRRIKIFEVISIIREKLNLKPNEIIVLVTGDAIIKPDTELICIYEKFKKEDDFLYLQYTKEETFG